MDKKTFSIHNTRTKRKKPVDFRYTNDLTKCDKCNKLYGGFLDCHANHLKSILKGFRKNLFPSTDELLKPSSSLV